MKNIFWVTVIGFMGFVPFIGEGSVSALTPKSTLPSTVRSEKELRMIQEAKEALREFFTEKQISAANANELVWWRIYGANLFDDKELLSNSCYAKLPLCITALEHQSTRTPEHQKEQNAKRKWDTGENRLVVWQCPRLRREANFRFDWCSGAPTSA